MLSLSKSELSKCKRLLSTTESLIVTVWSFDRESLLSPKVGKVYTEIKQQALTLMTKTKNTKDRCQTPGGLLRRGICMCVNRLKSQVRSGSHYCPQEPSTCFWDKVSHWDLVTRDFCLYLHSAGINLCTPTSSFSFYLLSFLF